MLMGQKKIFFEKMFTPTCVRSKCSAQHGIILRYVWWGTPAPPTAPSQTLPMHSKEADSGAQGGGGGRLENGLPSPPV